MKIELTEIQKEKAINLVRSFGDIHEEIESIQKKIGFLNSQSEILLEKLEELRNEEKNLAVDLEEQHGKGKIDPFEWKFIKDE